MYVCMIVVASCACGQSCGQPHAGQLEFGLLHRRIRTFNGSMGRIIILHSLSHGEFDLLSTNNLVENCAGLKFEFRLTVLGNKMHAA